MQPSCRGKTWTESRRSPSGRSCSPRGWVVAGGLPEAAGGWTAALGLTGSGRSGPDPGAGRQRGWLKGTDATQWTRLSGRGSADVAQCFSSRSPSPFTLSHGRAEAGGCTPSVCCSGRPGERRSFSRVAAPSPCSPNAAHPPRAPSPRPSGSAVPPFFSRRRRLAASPGSALRPSPPRAPSPTPAV